MESEQTSPTAPPSPGATLQVVGGGTPTPAELAALVVALTPTGGGDAQQHRGPAPWLRAAMIEGVGGRPPTSPADVDVAALRG